MFTEHVLHSGSVFAFDRMKSSVNGSREIDPESVAREIARKKSVASPERAVSSWPQIAMEVDNTITIRLLTHDLPRNLRL
jgi:hypothetical protein